MDMVERTAPDGTTMERESRRESGSQLLSGSFPPRQYRREQGRYLRD
jgi:hypothetical protein